MKVSSCIECPFMVVNTDHWTTSVDTVLLCNLIEFQKKETYVNNIIKCFNHDKMPKSVKPLKNCPLKKGKIEVELK